MKKLKETDLSNVQWKQHSHVSFDNCYISSEVGEINGKTIYRHSRTRRSIDGFPVGKSKITYSETMESKDLTEQAVINMINLVCKQLELKQ
jgi:hypothetical protein